MAKNPNAPSGPFHAGPGLGHELGVMFAFMVVFVLISAAYLLVWNIGNKKGAAREAQRREQVQEKLANPTDSKVAAVQELDKEKSQDDSNAQGF